MKLLKILFIGFTFTFTIDFAGGFFSPREACREVTRIRGNVLIWGPTVCGCKIRWGQISE